MTNLDSILKKWRHYFANISPFSQSYDLSRSHVWMWEKWNASEVGQSCPILCGSMESTRLLSPWDFLSKNTRMCCHFLLQGIFPIQGSNPGLSHWRQMLYLLSHQGYPSLDVKRWMWDGCESWSIKLSAETLMLLNCGIGGDSWVPWTARRSNLSILKEISPEYPLKGLMRKLKLQCFGHLIRTTDSGKESDAGKDWRQQEKGTTEDMMFGWQHWLEGHELSNLRKLVMNKGTWCPAFHRVHKDLDRTEQLYWTELYIYIYTELASFKMQILSTENINEIARIAYPKRPRWSHKLTHTNSIKIL